MFESVVHKGRKIARTARNRLAPTTAELKARQQLAFEVLHPQVEIVKRSSTAQVVVGSIVAASILSGNLGTAAAITGIWLGSRPLTHAVAGGVAGIGMIDAKLLAVLQRLETVQGERA